MGLFARLLRPPAPAQIPPTHISKPRVLGNGKGAAANKENVHPNVKHRKGKTNKSSSSSSGSGSNSKKKKKSSKKKGFWGRKKGRAEPAPKLSLFLQQNPPPQNDVASIETTSLTASHTTGSNTLSSKSMSTSSTLSLTTNPLHLQSQESAEPDADNIAVRTRQGGEVKATSTSRSVTMTKSTHVNSTSLSGTTVEAPKKSSSKKKKRKDSNIKPSDTTKESSKIKKSHMKGPDSTSTNTATLTHAPSLPTAKEERVATPYPQSSETKSKSKSTPKKPRTESTLVQDYSKTKTKSKAVVKEPSLAVESKLSQTQGPKLTRDAAEVKQEPTLSQNNKIHKIEDKDLSIASNDVVFDDLSIDEEFGDEDFFSFPHEENGAQTSFQITNMKSLSLLSPLASDSLSRGGIIESEFEPHLPDRTSTGEFAVIGSNTSSGDAVMRDVSGLQDIIDEVEKDMMELDSLFSSSVSKTSDRHEKKKSNGWAGNTSGWISNGAMQGNSSTHSEESSIISFDSDEFAEDDDHEHRPVTRVTNFQITTIIEENESDSEDPLEAALKRGEMLSKDAKETNSVDEGLISMDTSSGVENSNKHSRENSYSRQGGYGSVHTDSDLSDSFASTSQSASPPSSLEKSLNKKLKRQEIPRRKITKTLSWKEKDEIFTYAKPFKSINLEMALEMVRTYDPRYATQDRASTPPRLNHVQKPLKSILKKSKSWSPQEFSNDDYSISQESSSSTLSSNATSESVQYMVGKLKIEAARRRRKINIHRSTNLV